MGTTTLKTAGVALSIAGIVVTKLSDYVADKQMEAYINEQVETEVKTRISDTYNRIDRLERIIDSREEEEES